MMKKTNRWACGWALPVLAHLVLVRVAAIAAETPLDYQITVDIVSKGYDGKTFWIGARAGTIPGKNPVVVLTMQKTLLGHSDVFLAVSETRTSDLGKTWSPTVEHATLGRRTLGDGAIINIAGIIPKWNPSTRKLLGTGVTSHYSEEVKDADPPARPAYSVYDATRQAWSPWVTMATPDDPKFHYVSAGNAQRLDLANGEILLPVNFKAKGSAKYHTTILRCAFNGTKLSYLEHGSDLTTPGDSGPASGNQPDRTVVFDARQSGLFEPSLTYFNGQYLLTMRNRQAAYVARGKDGLHFDTPQPWTFEDGERLGSENTQQHWVTHSDGLFLIYTRRGANNDHVFRHRAPIFIAQVDPRRLCVIRSTERVLVPEKGVDIAGSYSVTDVNEQETWVTTSETMHPHPEMGPAQKLGADNHVYVARIKWNRPNRLVPRGGN